MPTATRVLRLVSLALWVGGLVFFAFVVAPVAFSVLPTRHEAGTVVAACLTILHRIGFGCGIIYLLASLGARPRSRTRFAQLALACSMLVLTAVSQFLVIPPMERDRLAAGGVIDNVPAQSSLHQHFDRFHHLSERLEGVVLLFGLLSFGLAAAECASPRPTAPST